MNTRPLREIFDAKKVVQDKSDSLRDRFATHQPYRPADEIRLNQKGGRSTHPTPTDGFRSTQPGQTAEPSPHHNSTNHSSGSVTGNEAGNTFEPLVPLTTQVRRTLKAEIQRLAKQEDMSDSATAAAFLEKAVQGHIDMQYGALLKPVIKNQIHTDMQSYSNRTANLALKSFYSAEQARILCINILSLLIHDIEALPGYIVDAQKQAWENMKRYGNDEDEAAAESPWQLSK